MALLELGGTITWGRFSPRESVCCEMSWRQMMQQCREKDRASHAFASPLFSSDMLPCNRTACVTNTVIAEHSLSRANTQNYAQTQISAGNYKHS